MCVELNKQIKPIKTMGFHLKNKKNKSIKILKYNSDIDKKRMKNIDEEFLSPGTNSSRHFIG